MSARAVVPAIPVAAKARTLAHKPGSVLQRKCECGGSAGLESDCEDCKKKKLQRRATAPGPPTAPPIVHDVLRSSGQPLDEPTRSFFEPRFGHDFSKVRVHADATAEQSARAVHALAYTVGHNVVFGAGQFAPDTDPGKKLLAHELAHVIEQQSASSNAGSDVEILNDHNSEQAADRASDAVVSAGTGSVIPKTARRWQRHGLQRQPAASSAQATAAASGGAAPAPAGITELKASDFNSVFRLDTITVIKLSTKHCGPCDALAGAMLELDEKYKNVRHPFRVKFFSLDVNPLDQNDEEIHTPEAEQAREIGKQFKAPPVPHLLIYVERELKDHSEGYLGSHDVYEKLLADVIDDASTSGAIRGAKAGFHLGLGEGALGWAASIVFLPLALVAGGIGLIAGALFGKEKGTKQLSEDRLKQVKAFTEGTVKSEDLDHSLAVDVVNTWADDPKAFSLVIFQKQMLIKNLMAGFTGDAEERAIIKILENSTDSEILQIFSLGDPDKPNLLELADEFQGEEKDYLNDLLKRLRDRFPVSPALQKTTGLLIDDPFVQKTLADQFTKTHEEKPDKAAALNRECFGVFVTPKQGGPLQADVACNDDVKKADQPDADVGRLAHDAVKNEKKVLGSFHTHPVAYPPQRREAPSGADIEVFVNDPARGKEHYLVGPLVTYVIFRDGSLRVLGTTADLLHVPRIQPQPGQVSTLELG